MQVQLAQALNMYVKTGYSRFDYLTMLQTLAHEAAWKDLFKPFRPFD
jgi:hypothetical protein